ncbi:glycosyltransferase family 2 protein [Comamonas koreensis]|uniref:Glycosyltransferase family 2 protein n=1 Tax=Comamonas koreensis TaxID=160825 RepID=A0AAW4Y2P3_9BURK|nr:glycosyltransferase family 2 protein [Comamonas koreensis]MCD2167613.1 glycosyltransferase family 2 protein [Comamonas koreensis]
MTGSLCNSERVAVLISTYNGQFYITDQLKSILSQLKIEDRVFIRDDGSTDKTLELIKSVNDIRIEIIESDGNLGFGPSFMTLIHKVPKTFDFYFIADQDDVWIDGRVSRALKALRNKNCPMMYCSRLELVNSKLESIGLSPLYTKTPSFYNAICQNIATGCTIAINQLALFLIRSMPIEKYYDGRLYYHDWWLYLNISYFGTVVHDPIPSVLYRQHEFNQIGMNDGLGRYYTIIKKILKNSWFSLLINQLNLFYEIHHKRIPNKDLEKIHNLCHGSSIQIARSLIVNKNLEFQNHSDIIFFKILLIFEFFFRRLPSKI